ncbi:MAG: alpha/beta fold hydrolase [Piscinibacter sp.]|nr:alpha/beta fold hydrolase [Piscinibacter sp.]
MRHDDLDTVLLLHSSASSARQWDGLAAQLQGRWHVHALDLHGHGAQPEWLGAGPDDASFALADDAALAEPLLRGAGRVHLVGHSYGAAVALKLATLHPRRVASVVAYEPVLFRWLIDDDACSRATLDVLRIAGAIDEHLAHGDSAAAGECFVDFWSGTGSWAALPPHRRQAIAGRMGAVQRHFDAVIGEPRLRTVIPRLPMPLLLLGGEHTVPATRRIAELLRAALPAAVHETLPGMAHMGPLTHPHAFNRRVEQHLLAHDRRLAVLDTAP